MLPALRICVWNSYRLGNAEAEQKVLIIFPEGSFAFCSVGQKVHLDLCRRNESVRIGQAEVLRIQELPLGWLTPDRWVLHLGGGDEEAFISEVNKTYQIPGFDRFSRVQDIEVKVSFIDIKLRDIFC